MRLTETGNVPASPPLRERACFQRERVPGEPIIMVVRRLANLLFKHRALTGYDAIILAAPRDRETGGKTSGSDPARVTFRSSLCAVETCAS